MTTNISTPRNFSVANTEGGLSDYFKEAWKYPILEAKVERELAERWRDEADRGAAHQLVTSHLRLVVKIAMGYRGYGLPVADLVSEGNIGLMKAVKKFEPERGFRLSTYAMWWIKASITEYVLRSWSLVKMGTVAAQKKLFFSLRRHKKRLGIEDTGELSPAQAKLLSDDLDIPAREVININRRLASKDMSLNAPVGQDGDSTIEFQDQLVYEGASPEELAEVGQERTLNNELLQSAISDLDDRERHIFVERRLTEAPVTLEQLGVHFGVSRERIRQLEVRAFQKVQAAMTAAVSQLEEAGDAAFLEHTA
ncbi:MAG: RNA polymerase sigma factor RpoH [Rhodospirillaceae bacterium]|nr:MAG: RNA polymerase sigma factor RpoH [Rhodospirillaceae bacterium]